ncbi:hypothetical protein [Kitasatospora sp. GP82]|uniref:hypothetical protein n=1 Tax=Kitasatospora sp. GP82 TaxID=3035089 RepID=UPI002474FCDD|nr:hypothetical protein [Kitasatospora sp. GP82]MDH6125527.1 hypothetical protein [Kitasatospora sp. GP82]
MRSPAELDEVQWHTLTHAYGSASDVPELIRALHSTDEDTVAEAVDELYGNIHHQGTVYPASAPAVPFLAHAARHAPAKRDEVLMLLATLADHDPEDIDSPHWPTSPVAAVCSELCRVLPELLPCLDDPERAIRRAMLRIVGAVAELLPAQLRNSVLSGAEQLYADDPVPVVRADALYVLARLGRRIEALDSPLPEVRLAAAMLAVEQSEPPYPAEPVAILAEAGADPGAASDEFPWEGGTTQDERLRQLLTRDPDTALAVAARWIEDGDLGSRGSWLVDDIAATWRDREPEIVALLIAALPHQKDATGLNYRLRQVTRWIGYLPSPGADVRDTLHRHARSQDEGTAAAALAALLRCRDSRALPLALSRPTAQALGAAAEFFPEAADQLIPAIRRELAQGATDNAAIALVNALAPMGAAARQALPELADCLRTNRAAVVAARQLGRCGIPDQEILALLTAAMRSDDPSLRSSAAVAHYQLTGDAAPALTAFETLLTTSGQTHWHLSRLQPLGPCAVGLLPLVEPLLTSPQDWSRMAAAEAHHWITGTSTRAVPVLADLVAASPIGLRALQALADTGRIPDRLLPTLRAFAFSPLRLLGDTWPATRVHPDEQLRTLARRLLTASR